MNKVESVEVALPAHSWIPPLRVAHPDTSGYSPPAVVNSIKLFHPSLRHAWASSHRQPWSSRLSEPAHRKVRWARGRDPYGSGARVLMGPPPAKAAPAGKL
jgi:hypothetical protein